MGFLFSFARWGYPLVRPCRLAMVLGHGFYPDDAYRQARQHVAGRWLAVLFDNDLFDGCQSRQHNGTLVPLHIDSISIPNLNAKLSVDIPDAHASAIGDHAHETGTNVADLVVVVQELDMLFDGGSGVRVPIYINYCFFHVSSFFVIVFPHQ